MVLKYSGNRKKSDATTTAAPKKILVFVIIDMQYSRYNVPAKGDLRYQLRYLFCVVKMRHFHMDNPDANLVQHFIHEMVLRRLFLLRVSAMGTVSALGFVHARGIVDVMVELYHKLRSK